MKSIYIDIRNIEYYEPFNISLNIKNGSCFTFLSVDYKYICDEWGNNLIICNYKEDEAYIKKIEISLRILSYLWGAPIAEMKEFYEYRTTPSFLTLSNSKKISRINMMNENINMLSVKRRELFYSIVGHFYMGLKFYYMQLFEEAFINFYKVLEILSKEYYGMFFLTKTHYNIDDLSCFLKKYIYKSTKIAYDEAKIKQISDSVKSCINENFEKNTYDKILFFLSNENIKFDPIELKKHVKTRNKLAHGGAQDEESISEDIICIKLLCQDGISKFFFRKNYNEINIKCKIEV